MVKVEVSQDDSSDGLGGDLPELGEDLPGGVGALHHVDDDQTVLTLEHDTVGQAVADGYIDIVSGSQHLLHGGGRRDCVCQSINLFSRC